MSLGKRRRGSSIGQRAPLTTVSPLCELNNTGNNNYICDAPVCSNSSNGRTYMCDTSNIVVAAVRSQGAVIKGELGNMCVEIMMDSGSSISLVMESFAENFYHNQKPPSTLKLVSAAGEPIPVLGQIVAPICVADLLVDHSFVVVKSLITPVILGLDFLHRHGIVLDFTTTPLTIHNNIQQTEVPAELRPILDTARNNSKKSLCRNINK